MVFLFNLLVNMGPRYVWFRLRYELRRRTGLLKAQYPMNPSAKEFVTLRQWKELPRTFFFKNKEELIKKGSDGLEPSDGWNDEASDSLKAQIAEFQKGNLLFFSASYYPVTDWLTNPLNGYRYDATAHWTQIPDFSPTAGDIKYVWEKSRFAFIYPLIRYDFHEKEDLSETVFNELDSWITANPINGGPNWRCSQEISLRVLNWTFALHYYKNSPALTEARFQRIMHVMYWQMRHVEANIDFSRIAVRNNHAITETLTLYLTGLLYPFFPESTKWKVLGKKWFEEEITYQIYEDGTFLQFSMNYHRVVVQLLTWGIRLAELNGERFENEVYERAQKSVEFLRACQDEKTGRLPNYGNNDGALFFPLSTARFRDYRPQLNALAAALKMEEGNFEDSFWYGLTADAATKHKLPDAQDQKSKIENRQFNAGGYYTLREADSLTFIRCGAYKDRPFQADNLHLDVWINGENLLRDAGSYLYNTDEKWTTYFAGSASHNTVMLGEYDQMLKGPRFVWYHWVKKASGQWPSKSIQSTPEQSMAQHPKTYVFEGRIRAFAQVGKNIIHRRRVTKYEGEYRWLVEDWLENAPDKLPMHQIWHPSDAFLKGFSLKAVDRNNRPMVAEETEGWYSELYGRKESVKRLVFSTSMRYIKTEIFAVPLLPV
ncbi:alginate lyase family protein [Runella slithyformis]|uniref:Heparinase II/III family protein n=1 Tax=Runella slithyformis (strain ATCC 29530 / DSM 19594 / LMG 11500 / NCIMB 11436 / LSU 4) TaxID=761193 RepID=A0A7U3ZGD9_RUNSL|nr:alginate lyase family protein [Runella slithyformis]AEI46660.1 Heparinase II/III family protein [Runella slithyformis DSM 19594]